MKCLYVLEELHKANSGDYYFLETYFHAFYGVIKPLEIVELYEIETIRDLFKFEVVKMIEQDVFMKKCKIEHAFSSHDAELMLNTVSASTMIILVPNRKPSMKCSTFPVASTSL